MANPLTVLVVDDDSAPRDLAATFLRAMGYSVLLASDGKSAIQAVKAHKGDLHLILTDVVRIRLTHQGSSSSVAGCGAPRFPANPS